MSVRNCPSCGTEIEESTKFCPDCGTNINPDAERSEVSKSESTGTKEFREDERSVTEVVKQEEVKEYIKYTVGIFLSVGIGYSLAIILFDAFVDETIGTGAEFILFGMLMGIFLSPLIASLTGVVVGLQLEDSEKAVASAAGAGSFAGFLIMVVLTIIVGSIISDGGSGGADDLVTEEILSIIGFAVGVAAAGSLSAMVTKRFLFE